MAETYTSRKERVRAKRAAHMGQEKGTPTRGMAGQKTFWKWETLQNKLTQEILNDTRKDPKGKGIGRNDIITSQIRQWYDGNSAIGPKSAQGFFIPLKQSEATFSADPVDLAPTAPGSKAPFQKKAGEKGERLRRLHAMATRAGQDPREIERSEYDSESKGMNLDPDRSVKLSEKSLSLLKEFIRYRLRAAGFTVKGGTVPTSKVTNPMPVGIYDSMFADSSNEALASALSQSSGKSDTPSEEHISANGRVLYRDGSTLYVLPIKDDNGDSLLEYGSLWDVAKKTATKATPEGGEKLVWKDSGKPVVVGTIMSGVGEDARDEEISDEEESNILDEKWRDLNNSATRCLKLISQIITNGKVKPEDPKYGGSPRDMFYAMSDMLNVPIEELFDMRPQDVRIPKETDDERVAHFNFGDKEYPIGLTLDKEQDLYPGVQSGVTEALLQELETYLPLRGTGQESRKVSDKLWYPFGFEEDTPEGKREKDIFKSYFDRRMIKNIKEEGDYLRQWTPVQLRTPPQLHVSGKAPTNLHGRKTDPRHLGVNWGSYVDADVLSRPDDPDEIEDDTEGKQALALSELYAAVKNTFDKVLDEKAIRRIVETVELSDFVKKKVSALKGTTDYVMSIRPFLPYMDTLISSGVVSEFEKPSHGYNSAETEIINPFDPKMANLIAGYDEADPDTHEKQVFGLTVPIADTAQNAVDQWMRVRGDSSRTKRLFWMSLSKKLNQKMSQGRTALKEKIDGSIISDVQRDESRDSSVTLGDWKGKQNYDEENSARGANKYVVLDVISVNDQIKSPVARRHEFRDITDKWTSDSDNPQITEVSSSWPTDIRKWIQKADSENDQGIRRKKYRAYLAKADKESRQIQGKRDTVEYKPGEREGGRLSMSQLSPDTQSSSVAGISKPIDVQSLEDIKTSIGQIKTPNGKVDAIEKVLQSTDEALQSPDRVSISQDEVQSLKSELDNIHSKATQINQKYGEWKSSLRILFGDRSVGELKDEIQDKAEEHVSDMKGVISSTENLKLLSFITSHIGRDTAEGQKARELGKKHNLTSGTLESGDQLQLDIEQLQMYTQVYLKKSSEELLQWANSEFAQLGIPTPEKE